MARDGAPTRDEILATVRRLVEPCAVCWSEGGAYEGANWTIDVFGVPPELSFSLGKRVGAYRRELRQRHGIDLVLITHTHGEGDV